MTTERDELARLAEEYAYFVDGTAGDAPGMRPRPSSRRVAMSEWVTRLSCRLGLHVHVYNALVYGSNPITSWCMRCGKEFR